MICLTVHSGISAKNILSVAFRIILAFMLGWLLTSCAAGNRQYHSSLSKIKAGKFKSSEITCKSLQPLLEYPRIKSPGIVPDKVLKNRTSVINNFTLRKNSRLITYPAQKNKGVHEEPAGVLVSDIVDPYPASAGIFFQFSSNEFLTCPQIPIINKFAAFSVNPEPDLNLQYLEAVGASGETVSNKPPVIITHTETNLPVKRNGLLLYLSAIASGMLLFGLNQKYGKRMDGLKLWAAKNPWKTRFITGGVDILLGTVGYYAGKNLAANGIYTSEISTGVLTVLFLTAALFYPVRKTVASHHTKKTISDLIMIMSAFLVMTNTGNQNINIKPTMFGVMNINSIYRQKNTLTSVNSGRHAQSQSISFTYDPETIFKNTAYQSPSQKENQVKSPEEKKEKTNRIVMSILAVILCVALGFLLLMACCGIWCNGMEFLAILLGVVGGALIIWILYKLLNKINRPKAKITPVSYNI